MERRHTAKRQPTTRRMARIRRGKPITTKAEDSLSPKVFEKMVRRGYQYVGGKWYSPKDYTGRVNDVDRMLLAKPSVRRGVRKAYRTREVIDIRGKQRARRYNRRRKD